MQAYECFKCHEVSYFTDTMDQTKCPTCGGVVHLLSEDRVREGMKSGVFYNIDPKTGKRAKPKRRR
jgi:PHP family Zn ribbon phosphoesterase